MKLGLIIGRFQPLHSGHVAIIEQALEQNEKVLLLVGSAQKLPDYKNPFHVDLRIDLIEEVFEDRLDNLVIQGVNDYPTDAEWVADIIDRILELEDDPENVTLYTSEKDEEFYRGNFNCPVEVSDSGGLSATGIRAAMYRGNTNWMGKCPETVENFLSDFISSNEWERLRNEYQLCTTSREEATANHKWNNPIEPVVHACVVQNNKVLLVQRGGIRGHGQWALPGGFLDNHESTHTGALRELKEETGLDLAEVRAITIAQAVGENLNGISTRTLAVNYLFAVHNDEELELVAGDDAKALQWVDLADIVSGDFQLFYNHNDFVRQLAQGVKQND